MPGLLKEIWISQILEQYRQNLGWMSAIGNDMSELVENNTINLAEAGVDPEVLVNNNTYPVPIMEQEDTALQLPLDYFDSRNTVVRNAEAKQLAYNKLELVVRKHRLAIIHKEAEKASHACTPVSDSTFTPVLPTSGDDNGSGLQLITEEDVFALAERFDDIDAPQTGRHLVLHSKHWNELVRNSATLKEQRNRQALGQIERTFLNLAEFTIHKYRSGAIFDRTTGQKKAYGAAAAGTDTISSFAFVSDELMMASGTMDFFERQRDPESRGDIVGFQHRFLAMPLRNKYIGAIYSAAAV